MHTGSIKESIYVSYLKVKTKLFTGSSKIEGKPRHFMKTPYEFVTWQSLYFQQMITCLKYACTAFNIIRFSSE